MQTDYKRLAINSLDIITISADLQSQITPHINLFPAKRSSHNRPRWPKGFWVV